jgi:hypothetical protein
MSSLTEQIIQLKKQQEELEEKINEEEETKRISGFNIERLEFVVNDTKTGINQRRNNRSKLGAEGRAELCSMMQRYHGFEVILEIFKNQDKKIKELEERVNSCYKFVEE